MERGILIVKSIIFICLTLAMPVSLIGQTSGKGELKDCERKCSFKEYNPVIQSHALLGSAIEKFQPDYPAAAKLAGISGNVEVVIIVDKKGVVVETCVSEGPIPLRAVAQSAAAKWRFKPNFGFQMEPTREYI